MNAMEASVGGRGPNVFSPPETYFTGGTVVAGAGWLVAMGCFFGLLHLHMKVKQRERLLQRGSRPDIFLYTKRDRDRGQDRRY